MKQWHSEGQEQSAAIIAAEGSGSRGKPTTPSTQGLRSTYVYGTPFRHRSPQSRIDTTVYARRVMEVFSAKPPRAHRETVLSQVLKDESGMSTIEYAMGSLAAAALAAVLYTVVKGRGVVDAIQSIIMDALSNVPG